MLSWTLISYKLFPNNQYKTKLVMQRASCSSISVVQPRIVSDASSSSSPSTVLALLPVETYGSGESR
jgi:hypothetical protein